MTPKGGLFPFVIPACLCPVGRLVGNLSLKKGPDISAGMTEQVSSFFVDNSN